MSPSNLTPKPYEADISL